MTKNYDQTIVDKGKVGEIKLTSWFQRNNMSFFPINQSPETFAHLFSKNIKRPDFFVLLESLGMIAVDAKNYSLSGGCFTLSKMEIKHAMAFEMFTRMSFWFAYLHIHNNGSIVWYWINVFRALDAGVSRVNGETEEEFLAIKKCDFLPIASQHDLGLLFSQPSHLHSVPKILSADI